MHVATWSHQQALLQLSRCAWCAEPVAFRQLMAGGACPHCAAPLHLDGRANAEAVVEQICGRWRRWRLPVYAGITVAIGLASTVPLAAPLVFAISMLLAQLALVRRPVRWLGPARRIAARLTLKLLLAGLTLVSVLLSTVLFPLLGVAQVVVTSWSVASAVLYVEGALWLVQNRLRREARGPGLDGWEIALPTVLIGALLAGTALTLGSALSLAHVLLWAEIPGVREIVEFLLDAEGR